MLEKYMKRDREFYELQSKGLILDSVLKVSPGFIRIM